MRGIRVVSIGIAVPERVITNDDLTATLETSDEWIFERTGIRQRRWGGTTSSLAIEASQQALSRAGLTAADIDHVVLATTTPDAIVPGTACTVQDALGVPGGAVDVNAACSGFVYGLVMAAGMVAVGSGRVLLAGSDTLSRITDHSDRNYAVLVGDGAGAVVIEPTEGESDLLSWYWGANGSLRHLLTCEHGGYLYMNGKEIFRNAVKVIVESAEHALKGATMTVDDIDMFVPHQANLRIVQAACERMGIPMEKTAMVIDRYANTSSASIPLALDDAVATGKVKKGDRLLLAGFGGGMTWASAVLRWSY